MTIVNNVTRLLDSRKIPYTAHELPVEKLGALEAAQFLGVPPVQVFKTIVVLRDPPKKPMLAVVPGTHTVDLKLLAVAVGEKKVHLSTEREAEGLTGLQAGGISPLALIHKGFHVIIDTSAYDQRRIFVSGGQRGLMIELAPGDLSTLTKARFCLISHLN